MGFFAEPDHMPTGEIEHAEIDLVLALVGGNGQRGTRFDMRVEHLAVVDVRQDVAVHDEEVLRLAMQCGDDRTDRAERCLLVDVLDLDTPLRAITDVRPDQLTEMTDRQRRLREALIGQLTKHDLEDRIVTDRYEWLGNQRGVRSQADALASCQDHGLARQLRLHDCCLERRVDRVLSEVSHRSLFRCSGFGRLIFGWGCGRSVVRRCIGRLCSEPDSWDRRTTRP